MVYDTHHSSFITHHYLPVEYHADCTLKTARILCEEVRFCTV